MSTLDDIRNGMTRAWDALADGWREFTARAGDALTRFSPVLRDPVVETRDEHVLAAGNRWGVMAAEIRVGDDNVEVSLEAPGMEPDDFAIDVHEDILVVRGEKHVEKERTHGRYHVMERAYGRFERALQLPLAVDEDQATARYERGVLHISLPRAARTRTRRISVRTN